MSDKADKEQTKNKAPNGLTPFKPGQSGNPAGRPRGSKDGLRARINRVLRREPDANIMAIAKDLGIADVDSVADVIAQAMAVKASQGNVQAAEMILKHTEVPMGRTDNTCPITINLVAPPVQALDTAFEVERVDVCYNKGQITDMAQKCDK
jgi:hypothetical protein